MDFKPLRKSRALWFGIAAAILGSISDVQSYFSQLDLLVPENWRPWLKIASATLGLFALIYARQGGVEAAKQVAKASGIDNGDDDGGVSPRDV